MWSFCKGEVLSYGLLYRGAAVLRFPIPNGNSFGIEQNTSGGGCQPFEPVSEVPGICGARVPQMHNQRIAEPLAKQRISNVDSRAQLHKHATGGTPEL